MNVLHHLFDPIGTLMRLANAARHKLVLEVASTRDGRRQGLGFIARNLIRRLPIIYVAPGVPVATRRTGAQKYFFTPEAVRTILHKHTHLFYDVEIVPSSFKQRFIVIAKRRKIRHLLVVSGPTAAGKSTFLRSIKDRSLPDDIRALLPPNSEHWPQLDAKHLGRDQDRGIDGDSIDAPLLDGVVLHYDFLRPLASATHTFKRDQALDLLKCADKITVLTLRPDRDRLIEQYRVSKLEPAKERRKRSLQLHRKQLLKDYESDRWLQSWYGRWRDFLNAEYPAADPHELRWPRSNEPRA